MKKIITLLSLSFIATTAFGYTDSIELNSLGILNNKYYKANITKLIFKKEVLVKEINGKLEEDVYFQAGKTLYQSSDVDMNSSYCKLETDEDELINNDMFYNQVPGKGVVIKKGVKKVLESKYAGLITSPARYYVTLNLLQDNLSYAGNFIENLECYIPVNDELKEPTVLDLKEITGGTFDIEIVNIEA